MEITYARLSPSQSRQYREIRLESLKNFPNSFGSTFEEEYKAPKLNFELSIENPVPEKFIMGAFDGEELVGICGFFQESQKKSRLRGSIIQMYVKLTYQGRKIGSNLLKNTIAEAEKLPDLEQITLGVEADNKFAVKIYEEVGFQEYGYLRNYFKHDSRYTDQRFMILYLNKESEWY